MTVRPVESWIETDNASNATATATRAAPAGGIRHHITGISGSFSAAAAGKQLTLKQGSTELGRWYVTNDLSITFPSPIQIEPAKVANLELAAGGSAIVGAVNLIGYTL